MDTWRIVIIGENGHRVVLDRAITHKRAEELRRLLNSCDLSCDVQVEREIANGAAAVSWASGSD